MAVQYHYPQWQFSITPHNDSSVSLSTMTVQYHSPQWQFSISPHNGIFRLKKKNFHTSYVNQSVGCSCDQQTMRNFETGKNMKHNFRTCPSPHSFLQLKNSHTKWSNNQAKESNFEKASALLHISKLFHCR